MGYGVIGSPTGSGPVSLGSSPGTPATCAQRGGRPVAARVALLTARMCLAPSSSGPGRRPLKAVAPVQIRSGLRTQLQVMGLVSGRGVGPLIICHWVVTYFGRSQQEGATSKISSNQSVHASRGTPPPPSHSRAGSLPEIVDMFALG